MHPGFVPKNHPNQQKKQGADDAVDDRETPRDVYDPLHAEFGFTLDVAAARHNAKCKRYYARAPWTPQEAKQATLFPRTFVGDAEALGFDGLAQPWGADEVVWCNPPFSDLAAWVEKAHRAACTVVMLLPANRTEQPWFQTFIEPYRDGRSPDGPTTRFLAGRKSFLIQDEVIGNSTSKNPPFGIMIVIWDRRIRRVPLSNGMNAIVDAGDFDKLKGYRWHAAKRKQTYYAARRNEGGKPALIYMHRQLLGVACKVDHVDGDGLNNRRANIRPASDAENARNMRKREARCTSRYKGVSFHKQHQRWRADIRHNYRKQQLGYFDTEEAAARAYDAKARELFGAFARLNFPEGE